MTRRPVALLAVALLGLLASSGCQPAAKSESAPAANGADYGDNKMPPAERLAPKTGKGPRAPGAPPLRR